MNRLISYFKEYPLDAAVIAIVVYLGIIHLSYPFHGDQALFMVAAKKMTAGGVLYKDFWDIKQPGIFIFFYLAGSIFGFTEVGIHFFELIYWLVFSIFLIRISRNL